MKPILIPVLAHALAASSAIATNALMDFGRNGTLQPDLRTTGSSPTYNNLTLGNGSNGTFFTSEAFQTVPIADDGGPADVTSYVLQDTNGAGTGIVISFQAKDQSTSQGGQVGTAGTGGNYTGTLPPDVSSLAPDATTDGLFINNSGVLRVTLSGLNDELTYDLTLLSGRNTLDADGGASWNLVTGTANTSWFQNSAGDYTTNTGQLINSTGTNSGIAAEWLGVSPSGGTIVFDVVTKVGAAGTGSVGVNTLSITYADSTTYAAWQAANSTRFTY